MFDLHQSVGILEVIITGIVVLSLMALAYRLFKRPRDL